MRRDLFVARQNHGLHVRNALFGEEHVLGAAEADAFGAELAGDFGIARNIGIGAHAELAAELVRELHELTEGSGGRIRFLGGGLTEIDVAGGSIHREPLALLYGDGLSADRNSGGLVALAKWRWRRRRRRTGVPIPRATTAAWLDLPPMAVRMPLALSMP